MSLLATDAIAPRVDVRSHPYPRWAPHFEKRRLSRSLEQAGIGYVHRALKPVYGVNPRGSPRLPGAGPPRKTLTFMAILGPMVGLVGWKSDREPSASASLHADKRLPQPTIAYPFLFEPDPLADSIVAQVLEQEALVGGQAE